MSLCSKNITSSIVNITLCFIVIILSLFGITLLTGSFLGSHLGTTTASALSYSTTQDVSFTINPKLSISLSDTNLIIDTLAPGNTSTSNTITITVASNTPYGYSLYADVGSNDTESIYYNTSDLLHNDSTINSTFTSIATNASLPVLDTDNTWGYSTSTNNGATWSAYNGLPTATSTESSTSANNPAILIDTENPADGKSVALKVAARASTTQASGAYSNVINFYAVGYPAPPTIDDVEYMQDFTASPESIKKSMQEHAIYTLKDSRDNRNYTVAKLKDSKVWMTQNLDLAGGTKLYSETSDIPNGYPKTGGIPFYILPTSSISGFDDSTVAYVYNVAYDNEDRTICENRHPCFSYYSWLAATAGSGSNITAKEIDAPYSICPKGWTLPNSRETKAGNSDLYQLAVAYGMNPNGTVQETTNFYDRAGPNTVPNFIPSGLYYRSVLQNAGISGFYWSSTSWTPSPTYNSALQLYMYSSSINTAAGSSRAYGEAVRCILK